MNPEIERICKKLNSGRNVMQRADYFLRRLNRKTRSMGSVDMLKYLICVDLSYRDLGLTWDLNIANTLGLKSKKYHNTFNKIQAKLNISKNKTCSFDQLIKHFKCNHIQSQFHKTYKKYQSEKMNQLPLIQRKYTNFATPTHKAAVFYVVATKFGKVYVDDKELCNMMHCEGKKFQSLCSDVRQTCFQSIQTSANSNAKQTNNNRKRTREEFETEMYCDEGYESRKDRKHREWKERVSKESRINKPKSANPNKRRKIMSITSKVNNEPKKMFPIFEKAKRKNITTNDNQENKEPEAQEDANDQDIDLKEDTVDPKVDDQDTVNPKPPMSAREAATLAAIRRQQSMSLTTTTNQILE